MHVRAVSYQFLFIHFLRFKNGKTACVDLEEGMGSGPPPMEYHKLLQCICFLRNAGMEPLDKQLDPSGPILPRERSVWPSVKYVDDKKKGFQDTPGGFSVAAHKQRWDQNYFR